MRIGILLFLAASSNAATYYIAASGGSDSNSCATAQTIGTPKATFSSAWGCLSAGDTLIVRDGTYTQNPSPPPGKAGTSGSVITVRAENAGAAKITGQALTMVNVSYLTFDGLFIQSASNSWAVSIGSGDVQANAAHHITIKNTGMRCPLTGATINDNACVDMGGGSHHNLIEDSWVWGGGRYGIMLYGRDSGGNTTVTGADNNTIRRVVIRQGPNVSDGGQPQAGLTAYYASNNIFENVIVIDSAPGSDSSNSAFYITSHDIPPEVSGNSYYGVLALNIQGSDGIGLYLDTDNGGNSSNTSIRDSVFWNMAGEGIALHNGQSGSGQNKCLNAIIDHVIVGGGSDVGIYSDCWATVTNSIVMNSRGVALQESPSGDPMTSNYNILYSNAGSTYVNLTAGAQDLTSNPSLLYIGRIESGSPGYGTGSSSSNRGADLTKRYVDGTKTSTNLWPWPNEARIKQEMCTDSSVTTGFCASASLTDYVWGYLGNATPSFTSGPTVSSITVDKINHTSMRVQWSTDVGLSNSYIKYDTQATPPLAYRTATKGYQAGNSLIHGTALVALTEGTAYYFQICHTQTATEYCSAVQGPHTTLAGPRNDTPTLPTETATPTMPTSWAAQYDVTSASECSHATTGLQARIDTAAASAVTGPQAIWIPPGATCIRIGDGHQLGPRTNGTGEIWVMSAALRDAPSTLPPAGVRATTDFTGYATISSRTISWNAVKVTQSNVAGYRFVGIKFKNEAVSTTSVGVSGNAVKPVAAISSGNPTVVTYTGHGYSTGYVVGFHGTGTALDGINRKITVIDANTFSVDGFSGINWTSGGYVWHLPYGYYVLAIMPATLSPSNMMFDRCLFEIGVASHAGSLGGLYFQVTDGFVLNSSFYGLGFPYMWDTATGDARTYGNTTNSVPLDLTSCVRCRVENNHFGLPAISVFGQEINQGRNTADIVIRRNTFEWPQSIVPRTDNSSWDNLFRIARQPLEFKGCERCLVEGNYFNRQWADAAGNTGYAIYFVARAAVNHNYQNTLAATKDITIRNNFIANSPGGITLIPSDISNMTNASEAGRGFLIENNVMCGINGRTWTRNGKTVPGQVFYFHRGAEGLHVRHNTVIDPRGDSPALAYFVDRSKGVYFENNLFSVNAAEPFSWYEASPTMVPPTTNTGLTSIPRLSDYASGDYAYRNNIVITGVGAYADSYAGAGIAASSCSTWGFAASNQCLSGSTANERLDAVKWYKRSACTLDSLRVRYDSPAISGAHATTDGYDAGADINLLEAALGRVTNLRVLDISSSGGTVRYMAPDAATCTVEYGTSAAYGTGTRVSDGGGSRTRAVTLSGLTSNTEYHVRALCPSQQPQVQFRTQ